MTEPIVTTMRLSRFGQFKRAFTQRTTRHSTEEGGDEEPTPNRQQKMCNELTTRHAHCPHIFITQQRCSTQPRHKCPKTYSASFEASKCPKCAPHQLKQEPEFLNVEELRGPQTKSRGSGGRTLKRVGTLLKVKLRKLGENIKEDIKTGSKAGSIKRQEFKAGGGSENSGNDTGGIIHGEDGRGGSIKIGFSREADDRAYFLDPRSDISGSQWSQSQGCGSQQDLQWFEKHDQNHESRICLKESLDVSVPNLNLCEQMPALGAADTYAQIYQQEIGEPNFSVLDMSSSQHRVVDLNSVIDAYVDDQEERPKTSVLQPTHRQFVLLTGASVRDTRRDQQAGSSLTIQYRSGFEQGGLGSTIDAINRSYLVQSLEPSPEAMNSRRLSLNHPGPTQIASVANTSHLIFRQAARPLTRKYTTGCGQSEGEPFFNSVKQKILVLPADSVPLKTFKSRSYTDHQRIQGAADVASGRESETETQDIQIRYLGHSELPPLKIPYPLLQTRNKQKGI